MKPETQAKLDKIVPLLAHWMEHGRFKMRSSGNLCGSINLTAMVDSPESYVIHVEPRVVYIPDYGDYFNYCSMSYPTEAEANKHIGLHCYRVIRFVEDLNWKPEDQTPSHLEPT